MAQIEVGSISAFTESDLDELTTGGRRPVLTFHVELSGGNLEHLAVHHRAGLAHEECARAAG